MGNCKIGWRYQRVLGSLSRNQFYFPRASQYYCGAIIVTIVLWGANMSIWGCVNSSTAARGSQESRNLSQINMHFYCERVHLNPSPHEASSVVDPTFCMMTTSSTRLDLGGRGSVAKCHAWTSHHILQSDKRTWCFPQSRFNEGWKTAALAWFIFSSNLLHYSIF